MVHYPTALSPTGGIIERDMLRLRFFAEPFKGFSRVLLFYSPTTNAVVLEAFEGLLSNLGAGQSVRKSVHEEPYLKPFSGLQLYASSAASGSNRLISVATEPFPIFEWVCEPATWQEFAGLISGLLRFGGGHQYLTSSAADFAQVIVSTGEYYDDDFELRK